MTDSTDTTESPAMAASRASWRCVQEHDKEGWLALMADDVCIEDPIGVAPPTNPDGAGRQGKAAVAAFYDEMIAPNRLTIEAHESHQSMDPNQVAHLLTLTTEMEGMISTVRGIFSYRVDDEGLLTNLRGWWHMDAMDFTSPS